MKLFLASCMPIMLAVVSLNGCAANQHGTDDSWRANRDTDIYTAQPSSPIRTPPSLHLKREDAYPIPVATSTQRANPERANELVQPPQSIVTQQGKTSQ